MARQSLLTWWSGRSTIFGGRKSGMTRSKIQRSLSISELKKSIFGCQQSYGIDADSETAGVLAGLGEVHKVATLMGGCDSF